MDAKKLLRRHGCELLTSCKWFLVWIWWVNCGFYLIQAISLLFIAPRSWGNPRRVFGANLILLQLKRWKENIKIMPECLVPSSRYSNLDAAIAVKFSLWWHFYSQKNNYYCEMTSAHLKISNYKFLAASSHTSSRPYFQISP